VTGTESDVVSYRLALSDILLNWLCSGIFKQCCDLVMVMLECIKVYLP